MKRQENSAFSSRWRESTLVSLSIGLEKVFGHIHHVFLKRGLLIVLAVFGKVKVLCHAVVKGPSRRNIKDTPTRGFMAIRGYWKPRSLGAHKPPARPITRTRPKGIPACNSPEQKERLKFLDISIISLHIFFLTYLHMFI